jgi:hypothetical protein
LDMELTSQICLFLLILSAESMIAAKYEILFIVIHTFNFWNIWQEIFKYV